MKKYIAKVMISNALETIKFETEENPVDFLRKRYGYETYIESVIKEE